MQTQVESSKVRERVRQEVPLLGSNLQSQQDGKAGAKQEVPPRNSRAEQAISLGHTCVADRTVFGPPPGETTGLGLVAWKREEGRGTTSAVPLDVTTTLSFLAG